MNAAALVGRDDELANLTAALTAVRRGSSRWVVLLGDAGIGKTRMVREISELARRAALPVISGLCPPVASVRLPFGPFLDIVRGLADTQASLSPEVLKSIGPLLVDSPRTNDPENAFSTTLLFAGVVEMVTVAAHRTPLLIVLEDMQWADPASVDLLSFLASKLVDLPVMVLLVSRDGGDPNAFQRVLPEIIRLEHVSRLALNPLPNDAIIRLLCDAADESNQPVFAQLASAAQGNPFQALNLLATYRAHGLAAALDNMTMTALTDLPAAQRQFLVLLSVFGKISPLPAISLRGMSGLLFDVVDPLVTRGVLVFDGLTIDFRHDLLREAVTRLTLPSERFVAHQQALEYLETTGAEDRPRQASEMAHHLLGCGRHAEAIQFAVIGAQHAQRIRAFGEACDLYDSALRLWPYADDPERRTQLTRIQLLLWAGQAARWSGRIEAGLSLVSTALSEAGDDRITQVRLEHLAGQLLWATGVMDEALAAYDRAFDILEPDDDGHLQAAVAASRAQALTATGQAFDALSVALHAVQLAQASNDQRSELHARITSAVAHAQLGNSTAAVATLNACRRPVLASMDLELVLRYYGNLTFILGSRGSHAEVVSAAEIGSKVCRRFGPVLSLASTLMTNWVLSLVNLGRFAEAEEIAKQALLETTAPTVAAQLWGRLAEIAVIRGDDTAPHYIELAGKSGVADPYAVSSLKLVRAEKAVWDDDPQLAIALLQPTVDLLTNQDDLLLTLDAVALIIRAYADLSADSSKSPGCGPRLDDDLASLSALVDGIDVEVGSPAIGASAMLCLAELARVHKADTSDQWTLVENAFGRLGRPYLQAYAQYRGGAIHLRQRATDRAAATLLDAQQIARTLGARPLEQRIQTLIRAGDLRPTVADRAKASAVGLAARLTVREKQILKLVAAGRSNRQISTELTISQRTADTHVSNILHKLDASNRTEAARTATRHGLN